MECWGGMRFLGMFLNSDGKKDSVSSKFGMDIGN